MPFVFRHNDQALLLFCFSTESESVAEEQRFRTWKLGWSDWLDEEDGIHRITTSFPSSSTECNPSAYLGAEDLTISFICRYSPDDPYYLLFMRGESIDSLGPPELAYPDPVWSGFQHEGITCVVPMERDRIIVNDQSFMIPELPMVLRAVPLDGQLLVSGLVESIPRTFLISPSGVNLGELRSAGNPVYKSYVFEGDIVFADQSGQQFEHRDLHWSEDYTYTVQ